MELTERKGRASDAPDSAARGDRERWRKSLRWGLSALCVFPVAAAMLPLLPVDWWWVRIGDYPRLQMLIANAIGLVAMAAFWRHTIPRGLMLLMAISIAIEVYWIYPYLPVAPLEMQWAQQQDQSVRIRVLTANVLQKNTDAAAVLEMVDREQPDVVVLCEVNERWIDDLHLLEEQFGFHLTHPLENTYGIALYTNLDVTEARVRGFVREDIPSIDAAVRLPNGQAVRMMAVHPNPPRPGEDTTKRDAELVLVGREVADDPSVIVMGDMNDVGWSRTTDLFQEVSGLLDPRKGRGMYATFDATSSIWRYPLDYIFASDDFRVVELRRLERIGSDHFPLLIELSYEPDAEDEQEAPELDAGDAEDAEQAVEKVQRGAE